jgi:hypothetical protein
VNYDKINRFLLNAMGVSLGEKGETGRKVLAGLKFQNADYQCNNSAPRQRGQLF